MSNRSPTVGPVVLGTQRLGPTFFFAGLALPRRMNTSTSVHGSKRPFGSGVSRSRRPAMASLHRRYREPLRSTSGSIAETSTSGLSPSITRARKAPAPLTVPDAHSQPSWLGTAAKGGFSRMCVAALTSGAASPSSAMKVPLTSRAMLRVSSSKRIRATRENSSTMSMPTKSAEAVPLCTDRPSARTPASSRSPAPQHGSTTVTGP